MRDRVGLCGLEDPVLEETLAPPHGGGGREVFAVWWWWWRRRRRRRVMCWPFNWVVICVVKVVLVFLLHLLIMNGTMEEGVYRWKEGREGVGFGNGFGL